MNRSAWMEILAIATVILAILAAVAVASAQPNTGTVRLRWEPPCVGPDYPCGSPAHTYTVQLRHVLPGDTLSWYFYASGVETTYVDVTVPLFVGVQARVAARDSLLRLGPFSEPTEVYILDFGPPGSIIEFGWMVR